jgi:hypothetical protein
MSIEEAIQQLKQCKARGVGNIVLAYWEADMFGLDDDANWAGVSDTIEAEMDWSRAHDHMSQIVNSLN